MSKWETVKLGDIATYINGYAFKPSDWSDTGLPIIRIQNLTGNDYETNYYSGDYNKKYEVVDGDILISWSASLGVYEWKKGKALLNQHIFKVVFDKVKVDKSYFIHTVTYLLDDMVKETHGSTMKHITKPRFDNTPFPYPPLETQKQIAANLDKATHTIDLCNAILEKLDLLVKARFVEMFGEKHYPIMKWNDVFNTTTGKLDSNAMEENGIYPFFTCAKEALRINTYAFDEEALLLAGNNAAGKYDVKHYCGKFNAYQRTYVLTLKHDWSYVLFKCQLEEKLDYLQQQSLGGLTKYLTLKILGGLDFIVPPLELQNQFAAFVEKTDRTKAAVKQVLAKAETLKKALMQEYFG